LAKSLWAKLGDIPTNDDDTIELRFLHFPPGTHREEIWHWFEDQFDLSVTEDLMHQSNAEPKRYITWRKHGVDKKTLISKGESIDNPDPDGTNAKMLGDGWSPIHVDPIPGLTMKYWRPNHRSYP
jgi:hypothetical protein